MTLPLSISVLTFNSERTLDRCLASAVGLASEIIVVDSGSSDGTEAIARRHGARFVHNAWRGYTAQNQFALQQCSQPWVLSIDSDEAVTADLQGSIRQALESPTAACAGWQVNRRTQYLDRWMWHVWYPEWRLRLVRRSLARWVGPEPHGRLEVDGSIQRLTGDLLHYTYRDLDDQYTKLLSYARTSAQAGHANGRRMQPLKLMFSPWFRFMRDLILKSAWRDGWRGVMIAYAGAFSSFLKQAYLFEIEQREDRHKDD